MSGTREVVASGGGTLGGGAKVQIVRNLAMTAEADEFLAELARDAGLSEGQVLRLALRMFKTAIEAKQQGKHLGVSEKSDVLDIELVGF